VAQVDDVPVTDVTRTVLDLARTTPFESAVVVADAARRAAADGRTVDLDPWPSPTDELVRTS
jgi:hypothetical protein